ncbi:protein-methionine-sulfoxide reductase heme-binding subunit MsrQ [Shimia haliotis]|uniref:Protein-methionine-sulfoxide reductase heme-binding subunit MsrQ n=1 Tax=Shimia haliotis TaxID=1280847 RepID=A0A1I4E7Y0_9RHOB|nr:protein-methionine-sulfoxide reductase heme-binding subunit MsrQ [Shimia haliotis]SFL00466.1 sulfoxide reductase heme-binding subunit YedZ [Shimia haliotis]
MKEHFNSVIRRIPKWALYMVAALYPAWLLYNGLTGGLGIDPVKAMEHALGKVGLQLIVLGLIITPLRSLTGVSLLPLRRVIGVVAFFYILLHFVVWLVLDVQILAQIWADILKRPYVTVGMAGLLMLLPLAATSNNRSVRKLGPRWRKLHKLTYPAALLGVIHYLMQSRGFQYEPLLYVVVVFGLVAWRFVPRRRAGSRVG